MTRRIKHKSSSGLVQTKCHHKILMDYWLVRQYAPSISGADLTIIDTQNLEVQ